MTSLLVDSHCHLNYKGLGDDLEGVLDRAEAAGVGAMLAINARLKEYDEVRAIAIQRDNLWCTVGVHPHEAEKEPDTELNAILDRAADPKVIGIGETGLDYYYEFAPREAQTVNFKTHTRAAQETGLPLVIHTREAEEDTKTLLTEAVAEAPVTGVLHCFTASRDLAEFALDLGLYISLSGIVTFNSAKDLQETAKHIPMDRLLVETDAPYLAPVPHRGKRCEPAFVADTARFVAELKGVAFEDLARQTTDNFFTLFNKAERPESS